ncbi:competence protein CglA [Floricoccus tropicus]|uniref:Competence protein CglA n=1 Tax=Floricoccus tropicus TaxID=1859473 RepID=A0A1E8GRE5_9LACT|nr:competence type IV pilus ATPase ComGA [Floricoccus tropicus]OFI50203.1 competence protein CglA [Floricoccus tropicus]
MVLEKAKIIIQLAIERSVHDIYFLPKENSYEIRYRSSKENILHEKLSIEESITLISHFKFISGMNVGEKRRSQLGSCNYSIGSIKRRLRLSTVGDVFGLESLVIRILYSEEDDSQFWFNGQEEVAKIINGRGLYLFSGPVGSGKTTLMYLLARLKFEGKQVITIEDPVEIIQKNFLQLQLNRTIGNDYDSLIKLSLRHMPDLVIVGEIRDEQTARAVIRASLTGYTVFSTIHAKSVKGAYERLLELGISKSEIENSVSAVIYQRLLVGKGLIDFSIGNVQNHRGEKWNEQLEKLFADGHISHDEKESEKIIT